MSWLAIDASGPQAGLAVVGAADAVRHKAAAPLRPGLIETLPLLLEAAVKTEAITHVAVTIGPGSFTGLRTAIALAQGYAAAAGLPLWGITVAEAYRAALPQLPHPLWVAVRARAGRVFLLRDNIAEAFADADLPLPAGMVALAGDAANDAAARLAARGGAVLLTNAKSLDPVWVARAAMAQLAAGRAPAPAQPLYVDPPEAKLPAAGLRPAPV